MTATIPKGFHPEPFSYHQELELDIDALSNAGDGIGRVDGWVVFVPFSLPGDRVKARVWRNDKNYSSADLVEIINPSPDRVEPGCRLFGTCGGCQYQHLSYDRQLLWKTRQVADLLRLQAGLELPVNPAIASPRQYYYRSKITPHFDKPKEGGKPAIGFLKALKEEKISVPGDVAIVGCNDDQVASFVTPGLSTVKLHNDLVGMMAAKTLMECLYTKREQGLKIIVPNQLILRESCPE